MTNRIDSAMHGALAGALATVPMSLVMLAAERAGMMGKLPPEAITEKALAAANAEPGEAAVRTSAAAAHFAFGAAAGAAFALMSGDENAGPRSVAEGIAFGLGVYAVSYAGWIPAMHILPKPKNDRRGRQEAMVAAHVVYGAVLGGLMGRG